MKKIKCMRPACKCNPKLIKEGKTYDSYKCAEDKIFEFQVPKEKNGK